MIFVDTIERTNTITIDGYSKAKTVNGALSDLGRYIKTHISESEGQSIIDCKEESLIPASSSCGGYFLEIEEVPCATKYNDLGEIEYKDGNFYIVCRIVK